MRVEIISAKHAFGEGGRKYLCGETPAVSADIAENWIKHGRAQKL